ncbi:MAG: alpha/beta fold hydrolase [Streptosporangiaceae bacterium]
MKSVTSADGTVIAYEQQGSGPALIIVDGAMSTRGGKAALRAMLAPQLTVFGYDRRGRGDSGDTLPYAVDREIEDIQALIEVAGGTAALYGHSSGAALALDAALQLGGGVSKIAVYEAPYNDDPAAQQAWRRYLEQLAEALAEGRHGDAVTLFMTYVGTPAEQIDGMRQQDFWPAMAALGPTLAYDHTAILGKDAAVPAGRAARLSVPALVMYGTASFPFMAETARKLQQAMPHGELRAMEGQGHDVSPATLAPALLEFLT